MCKKRALLAFLFLTTAGCGEAVERAEAVPLDELPPGALELAKKQLPGVQFDSARKSKYDGMDAIEIRGKNKQGKIREVEVDMTGKILEVE